MTEQRMTLIERLRNPAWEPDGRGSMRLNIVRTRDTMDEAANVIADLLAALEAITHYAECALDQFTTGRGTLDISAFTTLAPRARSALAKASGGTP